MKLFNCQDCHKVTTWLYSVCPHLSGLPCFVSYLLVAFCIRSLTVMVEESINYEEEMEAPSGRNPYGPAGPVRRGTLQTRTLSCPSLIQVSWTHEAQETDLQLVKI